MTSDIRIELDEDAAHAEQQKSARVAEGWQLLWFGKVGPSGSFDAVYRNDEGEEVEDIDLGLELQGEIWAALYRK